MPKLMVEAVSSFVFCLKAIDFIKGTRATVLNKLNAGILHKTPSVLNIKLEQLTEKHIPKDALIVINGGLSPQDIYFANRKGWSIYNDQVRRNYIDSLKAIGAEYLIIDKVKPARVKYPLLFENEYYQIFKLTE